MTEQARASMTAVLGGVFVALALWAAVHPGSFTTALADFGPLNAHLIHDFGAASGAFGIGLVVAWRVPSWRTPILTLAALWNGLHALSHAVDVTDAHSALVGWGELAALVAVTVALVWLASASRTTEMTTGTTTGRNESP